MKILHSIDIDHGAARLLVANHDNGGHLIKLGLVGTASLVATTPELAEWIDDLREVLGQCRVADMHRAMPQLGEVAS